MDNFFIKMFSRREAREVGMVNTPTPTSTAETNGGGIRGGSFEERIIYARNPQVALTVSAVYRATELRAKTIGQMPVQYQRKGAADCKQRRQNCEKGMRGFKL